MASRLIRKKTPTKPDAAPEAAPQAPPAQEKAPPSLLRRLLPAVLFMGFFLALIVFFYDDSPQKRKNIDTAPEKKVESNATKERYDEAKAEFARLRKDRSSDEDDFLDMAEEFYAIYTEDKTWPNRPAALWRSAQALEVAGDKERSEKHYLLALERYKRISTEFWKSVLADDALLQAAIVLAAKLDKPQEAQYLLSTIRNLYPKGDMIGRVVKLEQKLKVQAQTRAQAQDKAKKEAADKASQAKKTPAHKTDPKAKQQAGQELDTGKKSGENASKKTEETSPNPQKTPQKEVPKTPAQPLEQKPSMAAEKTSVPAKQPIGATNVASIKGAGKTAQVAPKYPLPPLEKIAITPVRQKWLLASSAKSTAEETTFFALKFALARTLSPMGLPSFVIQAPVTWEPAQALRAQPISPPIHSIAASAQQQTPWSNPMIVLPLPMAKPNPFVAQYQPSFHTEKAEKVAPTKLASAAQVPYLPQVPQTSEIYTSAYTSGISPLPQETPPYALRNGKNTPENTTPEKAPKSTANHTSKTRDLAKPATPAPPAPLGSVHIALNGTQAHDTTPQRGMAPPPQYQALVSPLDNFTDVLQEKTGSTTTTPVQNTTKPQTLVPSPASRTMEPGPQAVIPRVAIIPPAAQRTIAPQGQIRANSINMLESPHTDSLYASNTAPTRNAPHPALSQGRDTTPLPTAGNLDQRMRHAKIEDMAAQLGLSIRTVYIDIGHGGKDPGASHNGIIEKELVLDIGKQLGAFLLQHGFTVIYSRTDNVFVPLSARPDHANAVQADIFVSVHVNAFPGDTIQGFETYYLDFAKNSEASRVATLENSVSDRKLGDLQNVLAKMLLNVRTDESKSLAQYIQSTTVGQAQQQGFTTFDGGTRSAPFHVLIGTNMPAVLVEVGYCTHKEEAKMLKNAQYRTLLAQGIGRGIIKYNEDIQNSANLFARGLSKSQDEETQ